MAESASSHTSMLVNLPEPGNVAEYMLSPDVPVKFGFYVSEVLFSCDGKDLVLTGEQGGVVVIKDYLAMAQEGTLPTFELHGGEQVPGNIYLFAFSDAALDVETAAGPLTDHSAGEEVRVQIDSKGSLIPEADGHFTPDPAPAPDAHMDHGADILTYSELFSDGSGDVFLSGGGQTGCAPALSGAGHCAPMADLTACSFADAFDPLDDALRHVVDFHHAL